MRRKTKFLKMNTTVIKVTKKTTHRVDGSQQRMTSLEIAALSGKKHKNVMQAIRNMEAAWEKVNGLKFQLVEYKDGKGESRPCYSLTKTECLYVATKFNDEARAKLVIRWEELEREALKVKHEFTQRPKEIRLLACDEEVLDEADDILGEELAKLNRYSKYCFTVSEIAKHFNMDGADLNSFLADKKVITWARGQWRLTQKYKHMELTEDRFKYVHDLDGRRKLISYLVWTEKGRQFILDLVEGNDIH